MVEIARRVDDEDVDCGDDGVTSWESVRTRTSSTEHWRIRWVNLHRNLMVKAMSTKVAVRSEAPGRTRQNYARRL